MARYGTDLRLSKWGSSYLVHGHGSVCEEMAEERLLELAGGSNDDIGGVAGALDGAEDVGDGALLGQ